MATINIKRLHQAIDLVPCLLQDGLESKEYMTLLYLARSMNEKTVPGTSRVAGSCFPSLLTIARETFLSVASVRRALENLITHGYLTKSKIPGRQLRGRPDQNRYECNRYHVTPTWDAVQTMATKVPTSLPNGGATETTMAEQEVSDDLVVGSPAAHVSPVNQQESEKLFKYLASEYAWHPTMQNPNAKRFCTGFINAALVDRDADGAIQVLRSLPDSIHTRIRGNTKNLAGYLKKSWPGWCELFEAIEAVEAVDSESQTDAPGDEDGQYRDDYPAPYVDPATDRVGLEMDAFMCDPEEDEL